MGWNPFKKKKKKKKSSPQQSAPAGPEGRLVSRDIGVAKVRFYTNDPSL